MPSCSAVKREDGVKSGAVCSALKRRITTDRVVFIRGPGVGPRVLKRLLEPCFISKGSRKQSEETSQLTARKPRDRPETFAGTRPSFT